MMYQNFDHVEVLSSKPEPIVTSLLFTSVDIALFMFIKSFLKNIKLSLCISFTSSMTLFFYQHNKLRLAIGWNAAEGFKRGLTAIVIL